MPEKLTVAVPWSLTHYMPLNGFHPLYRGLFDEVPNGVELFAWDNIELSQKLRADLGFRKDLLSQLNVCQNPLLKFKQVPELDRYWQHLSKGNDVLTNLLPGDIEFHHTAPFPSFKRPFVFHCESFSPIFFPYAHQGEGSGLLLLKLREFYRELFESPLCLGIYSHISETLSEISNFFSSEVIDQKLNFSKIGVKLGKAHEEIKLNKSDLSCPVMLFVNSANQNPANFFLRGGHLVLRSWKTIYDLSQQGRLILRCSRPTNEMLAEYGVDIDWLKEREGLDVIWINDYLTSLELETLVASADFFLLPSASLHSVSIMQSMALGAVPIVSDTIGTDRYVCDGADGVVLKGVLKNSWSRDLDSGVLMDSYVRNEGLESSLIEQLVFRINELLHYPEKFLELQNNAIEKAKIEFSAKEFSVNFWESVSQRYRGYQMEGFQSAKIHQNDCLLNSSDWDRVFGSVPQPIARLHAGSFRVNEVGGCYICNPGKRPMQLHDWSPLAEYLDPPGPRIYFGATIKELGGKYLGVPLSEKDGRQSGLIVYVSEKLIPYPRVYRFTSRCWQVLKKWQWSRKLLQPAERFSESGDDIELVMQDAKKRLNVIRCGSIYYAIPQESGEFKKELAENGGYKFCIKAISLRKIMQEVQDFSIPNESNDIELIEEGLCGFNIIKCNEIYYAILQSDGGFDLERAKKGGYSKFYKASTLNEIKAMVSKAVT
jgi:glycosyltransferase involved in cell wall biosynthesis